MSTSSIWALAGHDPFGGAGVQADIRVALGYQVPIRTIITTHTAQNDDKLSELAPYPLNWLKAQWNALAEAEEPSALKIGLFLDKEAMRFLSGELKKKSIPVILDPVFQSSSGTSFLSEDLLPSLREFLWPHVTLLTPNRLELEALLGWKIESEKDLKRAAKACLDQGLNAVLIKGGHGEGTELLDYFDDGTRGFYLKSQRLPGEYRGTGCTLSTGVAAGLAKGLPLRDAVVLAHSYVRAAISSAHSKGLRHLPSLSETPELSDLHYSYPATSLSFAAMDRSIGFYTVAPNAQWIDRLSKAKVPTLQLRAKSLDETSWEQEARAAKDFSLKNDSRFFLNDHWRLAMKIESYGVHLGQEDLDEMSDDDLSRLARSGLRLGISTHSLEEAARAKTLRPSYIALGPVFETTCKSMRFGPQGIDRVGIWAKALGKIPVVAIGGLKAHHAKEVLEQGADGIAVISDITEAVDPESRVKEWLKAWPS